MGLLSAVVIVSSWSERAKARSTKSFCVSDSSCSLSDSSSISLAAIENGCPCPRTGIRKDSDCLVMKDERIDPIPADYAMPGVQWRSPLVKNIVKQDSTAAPAFLHGLLLA